MSRFRLSKTFSSAAAVSLGAAGALGASALPAAAQVETDEIVVTAQFREQRLQDTPLSITAIGAEMLEARSQTSLSEIAAQAPNVTLVPSSASFGPSLGASIRGVGQFDFNPAVEPGVGIYVDDVYLPTITGSILDLLDLERVEVLRGPQGTLTGRNSIGGAIRLVSSQPTGQGAGFVEGVYGSRNRIGFRGSADFAITDTVFARISGVTKQQDGYVGRYDYGCVVPASGIPAQLASVDCKFGEHGETGYSAVRGMLRFAPSDTFDLTLSADYTRDKRTAPGEVLLAANFNNPETNPAPGVPFDSRFICGEFCNFAAFAQAGGAWQGFPFTGYPLNATAATDEHVFEGGGASAHLIVDITDTLTLTSISAYRDYESTFSADDDLSPANLGFGQNRLDHTFWSQEIRLNGEVGDRIDYTLGGYYSDQKTTYFTYQDIRYAGIPLQFIGDDPVNADTWALFGTATWSYFDLNVTGGVRYTEENKDYTFYRRNRDGSPNPFLAAIDGFTGYYSGNQTDYRLSADYRWTPSFLTYATIATGFKGGGIGPRPFAPAQVQPFSPETVTAYEVGFKSSVLEDRATFNMAAFFNDYTDIQLLLLSCPQFGGPGPCALPQNAGDAEVWGVEAEFVGEIIDGLTVDGALSWLDFEYTRLNALTGLPANSTQVYTPEWKASAGVQYVIDLGQSGSLTPRIDASFQDEMFTNSLNGPLNEIDAYTLANARLTWRNAAEDITVSLEGTNLFDEYYFLTKYDLSGAAGLVKGQPGRPREWAITVRRNF
ncbi:MAG: TonB-dependent receptor [Hyphomonadaceae bacterium]|nr:TonB-dependent receptor [Hyphomonadaceae bacterium]